MVRKDVAPKKTIERIENILYGIGLDYTIINEVNNRDNFYSVRVEVNENGFVLGANGKGITRELALASGLAELIERLQSRVSIKFWYSTKDYPEKAFVHEYISKAPLNNFINSDFIGYNDSKMICYRIDYVNAVNNTIISVPNRLVNLTCGSNGLCAGNSKAEAIVQGASEVFERYVQKLILKKHIKCPYIRKEAMAEYSFAQKMLYFEEVGLEWEILDCTDGEKFPVVGLLIVDKKVMKYAVVLGSDVDFEIAVERCITELLQGRRLENLTTNYMKSIDFKDINEQSVEWNDEQLSDYYDFMDNYISNNGKYPLYLFFETAQVDIPSVFKHVLNNDEAYEQILGIVNKNNLSLLYTDFSYLGFPTYRVYIPTLSTIFEMETDSFKFIDNIQENMMLMMKISSLDDVERQRLVVNLAGFSKTYTNRRNSFQTILFKFCGDKNFDFNYLYLDFVISLLYLSLLDYKKAAKYYSRFLNELKYNRGQSINELLSVIYLYIIELANGCCLDEIREKYRHIFNDTTSQYVYEFIKYNKCLQIVYWPNCPECETCAYGKNCAYIEWKKIDKILRTKQKEFYTKGLDNSN